MSETCRVIINQVKQKLHLVGYLLMRYFKDARYHEHKIQLLMFPHSKRKSVVLKRNGCDSAHRLSKCDVQSKNILHKTLEACVVPQQPVINNVIAMFVLQKFSVLVVQCAVTTNKYRRPSIGGGDGHP